MLRRLGIAIGLLGTGLVVSGAWVERNGLAVEPERAERLDVCTANVANGDAAVAVETQGVETDLLIVGGTESGCAAAVQALRMGVRSVTLVNDIEWLGGQFSAEGLLAIDENRGPEGYGHGVPFPRNGLFREVIDRIEATNVERYGVPRPGNTRVITTTRPEIAQEVFQELLAPFEADGRLKRFSWYAPTAVDREGNTVTGVRFRSTRETLPGTEAKELTVRAGLTIDASDWGDVIRLSGAGYEFGPDTREKYGEPLAPLAAAKYPVTDMNPITYCLILEERSRNEPESHVPIAPPANYDRRNYDGLPYPNDPQWIYESRRLVDSRGFPEKTDRDVVLLCFPAFDYPLDLLTQQVVDRLEADEPGCSKRNIIEMSRQQRQIIFDDAKQRSLGHLYYLQTVIPPGQKDQRHVFLRMQLSDEFGTPDRLPPKPYVRESLRLQGMYMLKQQDTMGVGDDARNFARAMPHDAIACWQFEYDFHPTKRHFLGTDPTDQTTPWHPAFREGRKWGPPYSGLAQFPLRSAVPATMNGLLGAQKNLGYSSIVSSAVRLHDQSIAIGQGVGAVAAVSLQESIPPREIVFRAEALGSVWNGLASDRAGTGIVPATLWPFADLDPMTPSFVAINQLAVRQAFPLAPHEVLFRAEHPASEDWKAAVVERSLMKKVFKMAPIVPQGGLTRGEFCRQWWEAIRELPERPFSRVTLEDADGDEFPDSIDPLPLLPGVSTWQNWKPFPEEDGVPGQLVEGDQVVAQYNFGALTDQEIGGWVGELGRVFDATRGYGWNRAISANVRRRSQYQDPLRDTFLFTRTQDRWECLLANGEYRVICCLGDSEHEQFGQNLTIEGTAEAKNVTTAAGRYLEVEAVVNVEDGRLTIDLGTPTGSTNTCVNWLRVTRRMK